MNGMNEKNLGSLERCLKKAIGYLTNSQNEDGSWSGPLSSRIRETFLVYTLAKELGWKDLEKQGEKWLQSNKMRNGVNENESILDKAIIAIYQNNPLQLTEESLYEHDIIRKTLLIYCLGIIEGSDYKIPSEYEDRKSNIKLLEKIISDSEKTIKGWSLAEFVAFRIILGQNLKIDSTEYINLLIGLKDNKDNWFQNPATTAVALLALNFSNSLTTPETFRSFFSKNIQPDGGWSYCSLPTWDTGLSLFSIHLASNKKYLNDNRYSEMALQYLAKFQNEDGGWGFNEHIESEADTTSIILDALYYFPKSTTLSKKAVDYFKELQFKSGEFKGLWPVWRKSEEPSVEVIGHIVHALDKFNVFDLMKPRLWLKEMAKSNEWKAIWGRSLAYSIYAVVSALHPDKASNALVTLLVKTQNKDGGWGFNKNSESNASATGNAILALKYIDKDKYSKEIFAGVEWLVKSQLDSGTWPQVKEVIGPRPYVYADDSSTHNFALIGLLR